MYRKPFFGPLLIALVALASVLVTLAPDGLGPGVTCDESYHIYQGKFLVTALRQQGLGFFKAANIEKNHVWLPDGPPVQAPLGYWILGCTHWLFDPEPDDSMRCSITAARFAPALAFGLLVFMVGMWTTTREGRAAGTFAAAATALMPRLFAHAHLASLDMLTTLFFVAAVLAAAQAMRGGKTWHFALAGVVWGLAVLVRLHGLLAAPPIVLWFLWRLRQVHLANSRYAAVESPKRFTPRWWWHCRLIVIPPAVWTAAGCLIVLAGWPWLWADPVQRFHQYLTSGTGRPALNVFYFGEIWTDRAVPWHYPWVMFVVTIPLGLLALGIIGGWMRGWMALLRLPQAGTLTIGEGTLLAGVIGFVLLVFSWPGTPVYDGERLFLMTFPLWAIWAGIGAKWLCNRDKPPQPHQVATPSTKRNSCLWVVIVLVAAQGVGLVIYNPCQLSYYNLLVGGLAGAERLGFEVTYWGDTVREPMLAEAARLSEGKPILFAPALAQFQSPAVAISSPALSETKTDLIDWNVDDPSSAKNCRYAVIYHRRASARDLAPLISKGKVVSEYQMQGVWLARLIDLLPPRLPSSAK